MDPKEYGAMISKYAASGAVAISIALANDVGILRVLFDAEEPLTSQQIADKGDMKERYVREIVGALVAGGVVQVDQSSSLFHIKPEFKPMLKTAVNMTRYPVYFGQKYKAIMECLPKSGPSGIRYSEYPEIFTIMDDMLTLDQDNVIEKDFLGSHPPLEEKLKTGIDAIEIGSANGTVIINLGKRFPQSRFTGTDVAETILDIAKTKAKDRGLTNCEFTVLDVCKAPEKPEKQYDWIFHRIVIHDLPEPQDAINGMFRMLKPGGIMSMIDMALTGTLAEHAGNTGTGFFFTCGTFICIPESYQGGASAASGPCWPIELARGLIVKAGFDILKEHRTEGKPQEITFVCQKPE